MNFLIGLLAIGTIFAISNALPAKKNMMFIQDPANFYRGPKHMMLLQYMQPSSPYARSTQAVEALVAGDTVAAGSFLREGNVKLDAEESSNDDVLSVAEAFPEETEGKVEIEEDAPISDEDTNEIVKQAREINFDEPAAEDSEAEPAVGIEVDVEDAAPEVSVDIPVNVPVDAPVVPEKPITVAEPVPVPKPVHPKKKVFVELENNSETEHSKIADDEELLYDDYYPEPTRKQARVPPKKSEKPVASNPIPAGSFFPVNFGGTSGGAIAVANSFSTGEGGSAASHAIAHGSPDSVRQQIRRTRKH